MTEEERIFAGELFAPETPELTEKKLRAHRLSQEYNSLFDGDVQARLEILSRLLGEIGRGTWMLGPIHFHYGCHTRIGRDCFMNFNFTVQDDARVTIGDRCQFGPNVTIVTPLHPMLPDERRSLICSDGKERLLCYAKPVTIGNDCWFGANVVVCPGVTIGDGCVLGAGCVVTRDIPAGSFAAGVPARVVRTLTQADSIRNLFDTIH
jgi:acetyltransferase-like isoleucine patch superfamily enzyme